MNRKWRILYTMGLMGLFFFQGAPAFAENWVIKFYQDYISAVDGNRCPMYPSCSTYADRAFEKHGPVLGWVLTCDRLVRCGRDETRISQEIWVNNQKLILDPLDANDFWWFKPPGEK